LIRGPSRDELSARWGEIAPILERATRCTEGCFEPIDVLQLALNGQLAIYTIEDGPDLIAVTTARLNQFPRKRYLTIDFVAGRRLAEWWPLFVEAMDQIARAKGCSRISAYGRPGWARFWKARGVAAKVASEIMVRELSGEGNPVAQPRGV
jgi:hypothetical protein